MAAPIRSFLGSCIVASLLGPSLAVCPPGWTSQGFKCLRLFREPATWREAENHCRSFSNQVDEQGHLMSLADRKDTELLGLLSKEQGVPGGVWVGLSRHGHHTKDSGDINADDGGDGDDDGGDDTHNNRNNAMAWSNGLPTNLLYLFVHDLLDVSEGGDCARTVLDESWQSSTTSLASTKCDARMSYACELSACPFGWTSYAGNCYTYTAEPSSWSEAESRCQVFESDGVKGHLVSIASQEENEFLTEWQKATVGYGSLEETWIGLYGLTRSGGEMTTWTAEEDAPGRDKVPGSCAQMHGSGEGLWGDAGDCAGEAAAASICKMAPCPMHLVPFRGRCLLYLLRDSGTSDDEPHHQASIPDGDQGDGRLQEPRRSSRSRRSAFSFADFYSKYKKKASASTRFLSKLKTEPAAKKTASTYTFNKRPSFSSLTFGKSLNSAGSHHQPGKVPFSFGNAFKAARDAKATQVSAVNTATTKADDNCPHGWTRALGSCYLYPAEVKSWSDAEDYCKNSDLGGGDFSGYQAHLVTVGNVMENLKLLWIQGMSSSHAWIGREEREDHSGWIVEDGTDFTGFISKSGDQPHGCVYVHFKMRYNWGHKECTEKLRFLCEVQQSETYKKVESDVASVQSSSSSVVAPGPQRPAAKSMPSVQASSPPASSRERCLPSWLEFKESCYHVSSSSSSADLPWEAARKMCESYYYGRPARRQSHLASVVSGEENEFLAGKTNSSTSPFWVGSTGNGWLDGSPVSFKAQEVNAMVTGTCSYVENRRWGYKDCGQKLPYICKMPTAAVALVVRKRRSVPDSE